MPMVLIGVLLLLAKVTGLGPTAAWPWWIVLAPFAGAVVWWTIADSIGLTQRRAMQKMEDRKTERRERALDALGLNTRKHKAQPGPKRFQSAHAGEADKEAPKQTADPTRRDHTL